MQAEILSVKAIFAEAVEIEDSEARRAYLDRACGGDSAVRGKLDALLQAYHDASRFLEKPAIDADLTGVFMPRDGSYRDAEPPAIFEGPGTRVGPYKLLQQIGEGGMGVVYMAEQEQPVRRKLAVKIIKPGMDSAQVVARFEAERQALAVMDHINIARVLDAGATDSGRPYFVMELVPGAPITKFCDDNQLTPRARLELFVPVCQAIQHAHQKGIIHRDIKPSNVLVTMYDDKPVPKVIDFGVAKAIEQRLTERTLFTQFGALVGTFEYMSPEQAEMNALGVDTRSDIYSLGVLLYELLTGTTPLEKERLRQEALGEVVRLIKEEEAPPPSVRLSSSGDLPSIAAARGTEPARLSKLVRGEVDWIVMKCLEKDRTRRYESASGLGKDIERFLNDDSVEACPPSAGYRLRKFARKRRTALALAAGLTLLLVADVIFSKWQAARATQAEARALLERAIARRAEQEAMSQRELAESGRREAEASRESLRRSLYAADIQLAEEAWESGNIARMRELLDGQKPRTGETDLRGFEWHYLQRLGSEVQMSKLAYDTNYGQISPDGTQYVYVGRNVAPQGLEVNSEFELRLVDVVAGRQVQRIAPFSGETSSTHSIQITFSPDSRRFLISGVIRDKSGREDWRIKVFDWDSGRDLLTLADLGGGPRSVAFDRSGARLAVLNSRQGGNAGSDLRIWDLSSREETLAIPLPGREIVHAQCLAFRPDGARIAALTKPAGPNSATRAGEVGVWEAGSGNKLVQFETRPGSTGLAYSPDGKLLVEIGDAGASHRLRDADTGKEVLELASPPSAGMPLAVAFCPDGSRLAASSVDGKVRIWDVTDGGAVGSRPAERILDGKVAIMTQVAWSADGRQVFASGLGGTVMKWTVGGRDPGLVVKGPEHTKSVASTAAAASARFAAAFSIPDGKAELKVWDEVGTVLFARTDTSKSDTASSLIYRKVELSRDGTRLAFLGRDADGVDGGHPPVIRLRVWDVAGGREVFRYDHEGGDVDHAAFSPDGKRLATAWHVWNRPKAERTHWVSVWYLETGLERLHIDVPHATILAFSPDGRQLAGGLSPAWGGMGGNGELRVWDAATGEVILSRKFTNGLVSSVAYNSDGTLLAVAVGSVGDAGVIKVLDARTGHERLSIAGHRYMIWKLAFSPDGRRLASLASFPMRVAEVKLWDLVGGREMLNVETTGVDLIGSSGLGYSGFAFRPDGQRLFYIPGGSYHDAEVQIWDATPIPEEGPEGSRPTP